MGSSAWKLFFGISIGLISYLLLYVGKGIQKYAIEGFKGVKKEPSKEKSKKTAKTVKNSGIWIFGTVLTALFMFIQWIPLTVFDTPMNLIAPLEGFGLITLLVFSYFVLKEKITKTQIIGATSVIIGIVLINVVATAPTELIREDVNFTAFWIIFGIIFGIEIAGSLVTLLVLKKSRWSGIMIALIAGTFMAWQTLSKRISGIPSLSLVFVFVVFSFAIATLGVTQWAFTKIQANLVVPIFTSTSIILTAILGRFVINELIEPIQIIGMGVIVVGVILISSLDKPSKIENGIEILKNSINVNGTD